jgi:hypothetical protein
MRLFILGAIAAAVMAGGGSSIARAAPYSHPRGHDGIQSNVVDVQRVEYYWNHHHYHYRDWDRDHHRWHYHD